MADVSATIAMSNVEQPWYQGGYTLGTAAPYTWETLIDYVVPAAYDLVVSTVNMTWHYGESVYEFVFPDIQWRICIDEVPTPYFGVPAVEPGPQVNGVVQAAVCLRVSEGQRLTIDCHVPVDGVPMRCSASGVLVAPPTV